jgi:hypothetical protein
MTNVIVVLTSFLSRVNCGKGSTQAAIQKCVQQLQDHVAAFRELGTSVAKVRNVIVLSPRVSTVWSNGTDRTLRRGT